MDFGSQTHLPICRDTRLSLKTDGGFRECFRQRSCQSSPWKKSPQSFHYFYSNTSGPIELGWISPTHNITYLWFPKYASCAGDPCFSAFFCLTFLRFFMTSQVGPFFMGISGLPDSTLSPTLNRRSAWDRCRVPYHCWLLVDHQRKFRGRNFRVTDF